MSKCSANEHIGRDIAKDAIQCPAYRAHISEGTPYLRCSIDDEYVRFHKWGALKVRGQVGALTVL